MLSLDRVGAESLAALEGPRRPRRPRRRHRRGRSPAAAASCRCWPTRGRSRPRRCARCRSRTSRCREEARVRQRYVDLIVRRAGAVATPRFRADAVRSLRESFHRRGFVEVETPMLQTLHGGAAARPFVTHSQRVRHRPVPAHRAGAVPQARVVGGIEKVFEINRNFRNEGADSTHSPEFAMLEFYEAYGDYDSIADAHPRAGPGGGAGDRRRLARGRRCADGSTVRPRRGVGRRSACTTSLSAARRSRDHAGHPDRRAARARRRRRHRGRPRRDPRQARRGAVRAPRRCRRSRARRSSRDFPVDTSPLVRAHRSEPGVVEKWDLYVAASSSATGYSELVDPVVQRERLVEQARLAAGGDDEAMRLDEDFLRALEYGMPPTGGIGHGHRPPADGAHRPASIRETILFPLVKPEARLSVSPAADVVVRPARTSDVRGHPPPGRPVRRRPAAAVQGDGDAVRGRAGLHRRRPWPARSSGCGALHVLWEDLAEVRTVAVDPALRGRGVGHAAPGAAAWRGPRELGVARVFCLTFETAFFGRHGFVEIEGAPVAARGVRAAPAVVRRGRRGVPRPGAGQAEHPRQPPHAAPAVNATRSRPPRR